MCPSLVTVDSHCRKPGCLLRCCLSCQFYLPNIGLCCFSLGYYLQCLSLYDFFFCLLLNRVSLYCYWCPQGVNFAGVT